MLPTIKAPKKIESKGFTLIELLVVIAILAILASILFPVFAKARETARQTQCASNMRQVGVAFRLYFDDWDETFPLLGHQEWNWTEVLSKYYSNERIHICPSDDNIGVEDHRFSYVPSCEAVGCDTSVPMSITDVPFPSATILMAEAADSLKDDHYHPGYGLAYVEKEVTPHCHNGKSNWTFVDGHVKALSFNQTWDPVNMHMIQKEDR